MVYYVNFVNVNMYESNILYKVSLMLIILMGTKAGLFLVLSFLHYKKRFKKDITNIRYNPKVSLIVPCCNEERVLHNTIESLLDQDYENLEIIIVDDGSKDKTFDIARIFAKKYKHRIISLTKPNGGKASALNHGLLRAGGEIIICIDADSVFVKDTVTNLVKPFREKIIVAVAGNVKVANRKKLLNKHQAIEYITGLNLHRRTFAMLGCPQVISGAIGAFRRDKLIEVGGYSTDTVVEDMDVTITLLKNKGNVEYCSEAVAYTEAPETLSDFIKQRHRWILGGFQVLKKHKDMLFNPKYKSIGLVGLPYFLISTWIDVLISIIFLIYLVRAIFFMDPTELIYYYVTFSIFQLFLIFYVISIDKEDIKLSIYGLVEGFWYNHLISVIAIKAGINFIKRVTVSFNDETRAVRLGKNIIPA